MWANKHNPWYSAGGTDPCRNWNLILSPPPPPHCGGWDVWLATDATSPSQTKATWVFQDVIMWWSYAIACLCIIINIHLLGWSISKKQMNTCACNSRKDFLKCGERLASGRLGKCIQPHNHWAILASPSTRAGTSNRATQRKLDEAKQDRTFERELEILYVSNICSNQELLWFVESSKHHHNQHHNYDHCDCCDDDNNDNNDCHSC